LTENELFLNLTICDTHVTKSTLQNAQKITKRIQALASAILCFNRSILPSNI